MPKDRNLNLKKLTAGESLWLWRTRQGWSQKAAARYLRLSRIPLVQMELDRRDLLPMSVLGTAMSGSTHISVGEMCRLARRRSGVDLRRVAKRAGVSHMTVLKWERTCNPRLRTYWRGRGFTFG